MRNKKPEVTISNLRHIKIAGTRDTACNFPWLGGIHNFGKGEITIAYVEAPCAYQSEKDVLHTPLEKRGKLVLLRSTDHGETWPKKSKVLVYDNSVDPRSLLPDELASKSELAIRSIDLKSWYGGINLSNPESILLQWRFYRNVQTPTGGTVDRLVAFILRSRDKGRSWESTPIMVDPFHMWSLWGCAGTGYLRMPDGSTLMVFHGTRYPPWELGRSDPGRPLLYCSPDDGISWRYMSTIAYPIRDDVFCGYCHPIALSDGRLMSCVAYRPLGTWMGWLNVVFSGDEGWTWSQPRRINRWGESGPYPVKLRDGRILVVHSYRYTPFGIRGIITEDDGETWSEPFILREDGGCADLGYPVATQLDDGRVFVSYYFNVDEGGEWYQNRRFIAGSFFDIE